jgi:hypothetical protein
VVLPHRDEPAGSDTGFAPDGELLARRRKLPRRLTLFLDGPYEAGPMRLAGIAVQLVPAGDAESAVIDPPR